jgi:hypothetical protein
MMDIHLEGQRQHVADVLERAAESGPDEATLLREFYGNWVRFHRTKNLQARVMKAEQALPESHRTKFDVDALAYLAQKLIEGHHAIEEARAARGAETASIRPSDSEVAAASGA